MSSLDNSYFKDFLEDLSSLNEHSCLFDICDSKENTGTKLKSLNFSSLDIKSIR